MVLFRPSLFNTLSEYRRRGDQQRRKREATATLDRAEMLLTRNTLDAEFLVDSVLAPDFFRNRLAAGFFAARLFFVEAPLPVGLCALLMGVLRKCSLPV